MIGAVCPAVGTGREFVTRAIAHIDCQAMSLGQNGYLALASAGSPFAGLIGIALTLFIAIYGIRLILGADASISELILSAIKVGVVLALATSWPTVKPILYDTVLVGPEEVAAALGVNGAGPQRPFGLQLEAIDNGIVELTRWGTGRLDIQVTSAPDGTMAAEAFRGAAMTDALALGLGRYAFLANALGVLALVRLGAGLLLALTPIFAGLLLFEATRSLFVGWLRALFFVGLSSLLIAIVLNVEVGLLDPWLRDAIALRSSNYAIAAAPTELAVMTSAFAIATLGLLTLLARVCFADAPARWIAAGGQRFLSEMKNPQDRSERRGLPQASLTPQTEPSRAFVVAEAVAGMQRREADALLRHQHLGAGGGPNKNIASGNGAPFVTHGASGGPAPLGRSLRSARRVSGLGSKRDGQS